MQYDTDATANTLVDDAESRTPRPGTQEFLGGTALLGGMDETSSGERSTNLPLPEYRKHLMEGFTPFADDVQRIKEGLADKSAAEVEGYLASGAESDAFVVSDEDEKYVVRVSKIRGSSDHIDSYVRGMVGGQDIDGFEQLVAVSYEDGVTVGEFLSGRSMDKYTTTEVAAIDPRHFEKLGDSLVRAAQGGVETDGNDGNLLFDPEAGFSVVDYGTREDKETPGIVQPITEGIFKIGYWLPAGKIPASEYPDDYRVLHSVLKELQPAYDRWISILETAPLAHGLEADYFTRMDELRQTGEAMRNAADALERPGVIEELTTAARQDRLKVIERLKAKAESAPNEFMRQNALETLKRRETPKRAFPKGNMWVSRNDGR